MKQQSEQKTAISPISRTAAGIVVAAALIASTLFSMTMLASRSVLAQETKNADVIVQFGGGDVVIRSIDFSDSISGVTALEQSGLDVVIQMSDFGASVCSIEGVGCPIDDCFCQCNGGEVCEYWGYNYWDGDGWQGYEKGADGSVISQTGAIEGWIWGEFGDVMSPATNAQAAQNALTYLRSTQVLTSGGFGDPYSSMGAAMAIGANREDAADWSVTKDSPNLAGYLFANGTPYAGRNPGASGIVAVSSASTDACQPIGFPGPASYYDPSIGAYSKHNGYNAWAMLGALSSGESVPSEAVQTLSDAQMPDGGWEWMKTFGTDTNTTSLAIQALIGAGQSVTSTEVVSGLAFLKSAQNDDGGFTYDPASKVSTASDGNSTAYSIQAIWAAGRNPMGAEWRSAGDKTPVDFLLGVQLSDGSFEYLPGLGSDLLATQQAIPAMLGNPYPNGSGIKACPAIYLPSVVSQ